MPLLKSSKSTVVKSAPKSGKKGLNRDRDGEDRHSRSYRQRMGLESKFAHQYKPEPSYKTEDHEDYDDYVDSYANYDDTPMTRDEWNQYQNYQNYQNEYQGSEDDMLDFDDWVEKNYGYREMGGKVGKKRRKSRKSRKCKKSRKTRRRRR